MRLIDLFCKAGGAAMGYYRAGFTEIVGVDIEPQPHYPFTFVQADAMTYPLDGFDAIHASPPCQGVSLAAQQWRKEGRVYPDLIAPIRERLKAAKVPYVIENVRGADMINPTILNGAMFGMNLRRTRLFETSFMLPFVLLPPEGPSHFRMGRRPREADPVVPVGHFTGVKRAQRVMECEWMNQKELSQAIPPAYTEYIGRYLLAAVKAQGVAL